MTGERHLVLQELALPACAEWLPPSYGWTLLRAAEGAGYWWQKTMETKQLNVGDCLIVAPNVTNGVVRASQLGPLVLQLFFIQPKYLNGLLTVREWQQLEITPNTLLPVASLFAAADPKGQQFAQAISKRNNDHLAMRCALLQLWAATIATQLRLAGEIAPNGNTLRSQFRELLTQMTEAELSESSLSDLARQLHCSERHFSRLFRAELGVPFRTRQIELRLQRACQLLADSNVKIINVAYASGYRHLALFNTMFKRRFGLTPSEWRHKHLGKHDSSLNRGTLNKATHRWAVKC